MQFDWQILVTFLIVGSCACYLLRNIFGVFGSLKKNNTPSCGSCSESESPNKAKVTPLVQLEQTTKKVENKV